MINEVVEELHSIIYEEALCLGAKLRLERVCEYLLSGGTTSLEEEPDEEY